MTRPAARSLIAGLLLGAAASASAYDSIKHGSGRIVGASYIGHKK